MSRPERLSSLDGVRALAILWIALYHYAVFWTPAGRGDPLVPYGDALAWIPWAAVGDLRVGMFFMVSGFFAVLSLQRSDSLAGFGLTRLLRLWPMLFLCATLTFATTWALGPPSLQRTPREYAISLAFLPPEHVGRLFGIQDLQWLDGAYWTLWVDVRFYGVAAILYALMRRHALLAWAVFALASAGIQARLGADHALSGLLFTEYQPFLTMGMALAVWREKGAEPGPVALFALGAALSIAYAIEAEAHLPALVATMGLPVLACLSRRPIPILSSGPMTRFGRSSYAYYLLHQNMGLAILTSLGALGVGMGIAAMLAVQAGILVLSILLTERVEGPLRRALTKRMVPSRPAAA